MTPQKTAKATKPESFFVWHALFTFILALVCAASSLWLHNFAGFTGWIISAIYMFSDFLRRYDDL